MNFIAEDFYKLLISMAVGGIIGLEREYNGKAAGLRTIMLIAVGSTVYTILSEKLGADAGRIAANIVTGIGFLGGGIIFRENNRVIGLTTAATIWATAALGMGVGAGFYELSVFSVAAVLLVLYGFVPIERVINRTNQIRSYRIVCKFQQKTLKQYELLFREFGLNSKRGAQNRVNNQIVGNWQLKGSEKQHERLIKQLLNDPEVLEFDF
jgi:putative Mg2+ transporter-C (MgtC) family protein